ncbi:hypothetical protein CHS0354_009024 [Potamilus streckersoni]|uniref:VPS10 domain-containing protein n=1 Tax=Potamilus streckersoni TaxID=2493646 RepID=A0AAE0THP6_9BIVA|nr:hypothetical protein CHS0354_009024 [Potamilus streckersoni]
MEERLIKFVGAITLNLSFILINTICTQWGVYGVDVLKMQQFAEDEQTVRHNFVKREASDSGTESCLLQEANFLSDVKSGIKIDDRYVFENNSDGSMALAWAGENDGTFITVTTQVIFGSTSSYNVYRSTDFGKTFENISNKFSTPIQHDIGLQRSPDNAQKLYLLGEGGKGTVLYITTDGGLTYTSVNLDFKINDKFIYHEPITGYENYMLVSSDMKDLYVTKDNGMTWKKILSKLQRVKWGIYENTTTNYVDRPQTIYATIGEDAIQDSILSHFFQFLQTPVYELKKSDDAGDTWVTLLKDVAEFGHSGKFLYASIVKEPSNPNSQRFLKISTDGGKTWNEARLPTVTQDRFYSVLDMSEGLVFMHVDDPGDTGHGVLYTSDSAGIIYSESLQNHLYPNFGDTTDFYRVQSMRGVYITSQMNSDDSIHSMISYNRGATWQKIQKPDGAQCKDDKKECYLQIHGLYSISRGLQTQLPLSSASATGIVLVHGNVADALQTTEPDVFISNDGGYNWKKILTGHHMYQIADSGGLLVAVPNPTKEPKELKFSADQGNCWHSYQFTNESIHLTGLLTEPGEKSIIVSIWGYRISDKKWVSHVIDFKKVIKRQCDKSDYEPWTPHIESRKEEGLDISGCLLGKRETIMRLKKDSWCYNGYEYEKESTTKICQCTREDYECEYGYYRPDGSDYCVKVNEFKGPDIDICLRGHEEKIVTTGYRKVPGDVCANGFAPNGGQFIDLNKRCSEELKDDVIKDETAPSQPNKGEVHKTAVIVLAVIILFVVILISIFLARRYFILRRNRVVYRYSLLNQNEDNVEHDLENALTSNGSALYQDSDEEVDSMNKPKMNSNHSNSQPRSTRPHTAPTKHISSYHDDSDDDMLG